MVLHHISIYKWIFLIVLTNIIALSHISMPTPAATIVNTWEHFCKGCRSELDTTYQCSTSLRATQHSSFRKESELGEHICLRANQNRLLQRGRITRWPQSNANSIRIRAGYWIRNGSASGRWHTPRVLWDPSRYFDHTRQNFTNVGWASSTN